MNKTFVIVLTSVLASTCVYAGPKGKDVVKAVKAATTNPAALSRLVTRPGPIVDAKITARQVLVPPQPVTQVAPCPRVPGLDPKNMGPHFSALRSEI